MKTAIFITAIAAAVPAVWSLPASVASRSFVIPTCGAETCLASTNGNFVATGAPNGIAPNDLGRICSLPQEDVTRYVETVKPCVDGDVGKKACTPGAIYQYKDLLETVCELPEYNKKVQWA